MGVTGDVSCWRCEMMGDVGVRQLMSDDVCVEIRREQSYRDVMASSNISVPKE